ncbi:hypothetical protein [uncultured Bosea sp.]|uniref:hypothetical protein n=1 Tax=uncultured Bosea sp. TaxID=211457 RepID=UPI0025CE86D5|nr:hypothetical protein [uncultured Bosea sp.]
MTTLAWNRPARHANAARAATFPQRVAEQRGPARVAMEPAALPPHRESLMLVSRNLLAVLVLVLVAALAVTGYSLYQEKKQPDGVEISVGKNGLSIKEK